MATDRDGWPEYERLVMTELERHSDWLRGIDSRVQKLHTEVVVLKLKATLWGAVAGALAACAPMLFLLWKNS